MTVERRHYSPNEPAVANFVQPLSSLMMIQPLEYISQKLKSVDHEIHEATRNKTKEFVFNVLSPFFVSFRVLSWFRFASSVIYETASNLSLAMRHQIVRAPLLVCYYPSKPDHRK